MPAGIAVAFTPFTGCTSSPTRTPTAAAAVRNRSTAWASRRANSGAGRRGRGRACSSIFGRAISRPSRAGRGGVGRQHSERGPWVVHRVRALAALPLAQGLLSTEVAEKVVQTYEKDVGPMNGAKVVARAWVDPAYKQRLLADGTAAIAELGFGGRGGGDKLVAIENTPAVHNIVVCTLCSCYPWPVLGLPPVWYKSPAYRSRAVLEPRRVLAEFGVTLPEETEIRIWDSSAEIRYMVVPIRPEGSEHLSEAELAALVTRDAMIGVAQVASPAAAR